MPDRLKWRRRLVLLVYNLLLPFALFILLPGSIRKMRKRGGYGRNFWQRFGMFSSELKKILRQRSRPIWMHAVSVGEVGVARKLIEALLSQDPALQVVLSTTTSTGYAVAIDNAPPNLLVIYNPVDIPLCASRALSVIRPIMLVLVEAEVWPNLAALAKRRGVPIALVNARLSPRSARRYVRFRWFVETIFSLLDRVTVQFPEDLERWQQIGVAAERLSLTGSVKYDHTAGDRSPRVAEFQEVLERLWGRPLPPFFLGASTFPGEEVAFARLLRQVQQNVPALRAVLVPRHVERSSEVKADLEQLGISVALRTAALPTEGADVLLVNTTGELRDWQALPSVVIIGKSFLAEGGQNPVEAIVAGTPVITGPHMENFGSVMKLLLAANSVTQVSSLSALPQAVAWHLENDAEACRRAELGRQALAPHCGAAQRTAELLMGLRSTKGGGVTC